MSNSRSWFITSTLSTSFSHRLEIPSPKKACGQRNLNHSPLTPSIVVRGTHPRTALNRNLMGNENQCAERRKCGIPDSSQ